VAPHADPPIEWSEEHNVRWKVALDGVGHATPVLWGERLFLTAAVPIGDPLEPEPDTAPGAHDNAPVTHRQAFVALAVRREDGRVLWQRTLNEELPHERAHVSGTFASASPVTDGEHVFAFFGSRGLFCLDVDGHPVWQTDLGEMSVKHAHGEGSSPALFEDTLVVNWDHEGDSFAVAFDKRTGEERWRVARDEPTSWASPIVVEVGGAPQVVISGTNRVRGYDLATGEVVWECGGLSHNVVASPVSAGGVLYAGSSYEKQAMIALQLEGAKGDVTDTDSVLWYRRRMTPYVPSPLLYDGALYFLHHYQGFLARVEAVSGKQPGRPLRLVGMDDVYASPLGAAGRVYVVDRSGATAVIEHGPEPRVLSLNRLGDSFSASPIAADGELYLRGERFLYCLAREASERR
jgi:outer membrane protein assembly factor BamB